MIGRHISTIALFAVLVSGCHGQQPPAAIQTPAPAVASAPAPVETGGPVFDGQAAYQLLVDQCNMGKRTPGTPVHEECLRYIVNHLRPYADKVMAQPFTFRDDSRNVTLELNNVLALFNPEAHKKIMLFTHWDTRPTADEEIDPAARKVPIMGADDGASGTAVLLQLAKVLHEQKPNVCVELLFVDGEDWGPGEDKMYLGARQFAAHPGPYKPDYAILLDMIGQKNLAVYREATSDALHPDLDDMVWNDAAALGYTAEFPNSVKYTIGDDHNSFNKVGIPAIDLIDFDYAYWHTAQDTADKCSPDSLKVIGNVMEKVIYSEVDN